MKLRISLVDYLNSAPLGWYFLHGPRREHFEVVPSSPARCADDLAAGTVDVGLIPSIEYQRIAGLTVIPGIAVAAAGPVRSVLLVRPKSRPAIRTVALDTSSRTSAVLLELLLRGWFGIVPELIPHSPDLDAMLSRCDAALLIGDAALRLQPEGFEIVDLAATWVAWQQRPFVFAFWACRPGLEADVRGLVEEFHEAKAWGLGAREEIVAAYARRLALDPAFLRRYLQENIDYQLSASHVEGLETFYRLAYESRLIERLERVRFLPSAVEISGVSVPS
jgi:chorismate dehydratase